MIPRHANLFSNSCWIGVTNQFYAHGWYRHAAQIWVMQTWRENSALWNILPYFCLPRRKLSIHRFILPAIFDWKISQSSCAWETVSKALERFKDTIIVLELGLLAFCPRTMYKAVVVLCPLRKPCWWSANMWDSNTFTTADNNDICLYEFSAVFQMLGITSDLSDSLKKFR